MTQSNDTVILSDIDTFVTALTTWHKKQIATLAHMQKIPNGTEVCFNEGKTDVLTGDLLKGFIMGIELALIEMGTLPFVTVLADET